MLNDITIGQYFPANSIIHKMDPRAKIIMAILYIVFVFLATNLFSMVLMIFTLIAFVLMTKVPFKIYLKNLKTILPIVIFTSIINVFYIERGREIVSFWIVKITEGGVVQSAYITLRIILLVLASSLLTYTTTPTALTDAIESMLLPLRFIGLGGAVHTMAMMMTIALRFIPNLIEETDKIMNAQKARGADMESGGPIKRLKAFLPILVPLLISAFRRAYELAEAMESRCYNGGKGRSRMNKLKYSKRDFAMLALTLIICGGVIALNILYKSMFGNLWVL